MGALAAGGSYAAALETYRNLRALLHRELNAESDAATQALFQQIRQEARDAAQRPAPRPVTRDVAPRHNLPRQLTSFVGREREILSVKELLAGSCLLTLTGSGGCGKTRLALQLAGEVLDEYTDGVWLVELAALSDVARVPQTVAFAIGLREEPNRPLTATLTDFLRPKSVLLVLDNCEHLLSACAQLAEALLRSCPGLRILATSREPLAVHGEQIERVPSLTVPEAASPPSVERLLEYEAVQLFVDRARLARSTFGVTPSNASAVSEVCRRLDGIPLAIELAAARMGALTVEQIAARLDDQFRLLSGGGRARFARHQTLRSTIDWSCSLLSPSERILLRRCSVFGGGWTLPMAEAVCAGEDLDTWSVFNNLGTLTAKSLVVADCQGRHESAQKAGVKVLTSRSRDPLPRPRRGFPPLSRFSSGLAGVLRA